MPEIKSAYKPSQKEISDNERKYHPCDAEMELMLADALDLTEEIYVGLRNSIVRPLDISKTRFQKILEVKARIFNTFVGKKLLIDELFDDLEQQCSLALSAMGFETKYLLKNNLCPKFYKVKSSIYPIDEEDEITEYVYYPIISPEILDIKYPLELLMHILMQQLQKNNINIPEAKKRALFLKTDGWMSFFGVVPQEQATKALQKAMVFIDAPDYVDSDTRFHGALSHAIQEWLISKLLAGHHLGDLAVPGERDITERDLLKADAWRVARGGVEGVRCLFDIMRERRPKKLDLLQVYPDEFYGFTSPEFVVQYLMLSAFRFPCLSTLLYNQYAHQTRDYFNLLPGFTILSPEEQLQLMNIHQKHTSLSSDFNQFLKEHQTSLSYNKDTQSRIRLQAKSAPLFKFATTYDDSDSYIRGRKKAALTANEEQPASPFTITTLNN